MIFDLAARGADDLSGSTVEWRRWAHLAKSAQIVKNNGDNFCCSAVVTRF
jgi:hypothetical protein